jgi:hypothetical protein
MARPAKGDEIVRQQRSAFLGVLAAVAVFTAGCGPTDAGIGTNVKTNLTADETIKTAQIDVGVKKQVVTLSGTVDTSAVKERAVALARGTVGVADVVDQSKFVRLENGSKASGPSKHGKGKHGKRLVI